MLLIELTKKGRQVAEQYLPVVHRHQREWFEAIDVTEQGVMIDLLRRLQGVLADEAGAAGE